MDWRILAFTVGATVATTLLFGTAPACRAAAADPMEAMKEQSRGAAGSSRNRAVSGLVIAQVALSVVLVVAASLFLRTFASLATLHLGFEPGHVLAVTVNAQRTGVAPTGRIALFQRVDEAVLGLPGVGAAGLSVVTPASGQGWNDSIRLSGMAPLPGRQSNTFMNGITPGWFGAMSTPLVAGRHFTDRDRKGTPRAAIVNQAFARRFLNGASPVGRTALRGAVPGLKDEDPPLEIVGVVADAVYRNLREPVPPTMYVPIAQMDEPFSIPSLTLMVRPTSGSPALLTPSVAAAIGRVNPDLALTFRPLSDVVNASLTQERLVATLAGFFGGLALLLAALGLYGVTSYTVHRRRAEIGIRLALGAAPAGVVHLVLRRVAFLVGIGVIVGAGVSVWAARFVETLLWGLTPRDPVTLAGACATLAAVGALAGWLPAWRASHIDPAAVLRDS